MSNPTSNFGWQMPTTTDLVTDLPADFEVFGQAVDTALMDLKGGTTGQVLSKTSNTDMDFTWVAQDDSNAIQNAIVDAKGDLIGATAADTPARLAVGTNGQVLTADSTAATGLAWTTPSSGGMTSLASGTLSGSTVTLSSISGAYNNLRLVIRRFDPSDDGQPIRMRFNNDSSAAYNDIAAMTNSSRGFSNSEINVGGGQDNGTSYSSIVIDIPDYAFAGNWKMGQYQAMTNNETSPGNSNFYWYGFQWNTGATFAAISRIDLFLSSGTFSGGTYVLYGEK
jgi:hypothetical protein